MEQGEETFIDEDHTKKLKQNFEYINQNHAYHIVIINTAVNTHQMQPSKLQFFTNCNTHTMQHP
jgi:hypothetical protein